MFDAVTSLINQNPADVRIAGTAAVAAMSCALPGVWLVLRRHSMMGDALSHTALPGVVLAFLAVHGMESAGWVDPVSGSAALHLVLFLGAVLLGVLTSLITEWVQKLGRVESGAALGVVFTWFFALGLLLLVLFADDVHIDPDCVLFGLLENVAWESGIPGAARVNGAALLINLVLMLLFYKELKVAAFDPSLATSLGINARVMHYALMAATAVTVVAAFETVGVILVIGLLIAPAAAASLLTRRLAPMIALSLVIAAAAGILGHLAARTLPALIFPRIGFPEVEDVQTSGMVAVVAALLFVAAWIFAPRHGLLGTAVAQVRINLEIAADDLLGLLYRLEERHQTETTALAPALVGQKRGLGKWLTYMVVGHLRRKQFVAANGDGLRLTSKGQRRARKLVRFHRLWESYLEKHFALPADHLHAPAHRVEHYIDEELGEELASELESPAEDPHGRAIPPSPQEGESE
mgnify:CR=1 FL=1